uniref:S1 motif domain-containing protein n=1 Tax=Elaeophora elaphi TaxID=1147741 RepID=A0A0R3RL22_9BILA
MTENTGLVTHQTDNGLLYVFVPGKHPDFVIDQRKISNGEQRFHVGDFISFVDINGSVTSPTRINKLFETRLLNNSLQVKVSVAFPPEEFSEQTNFITFTAYNNKKLAWSPDFAFVGCSPNVTKPLCRNQMYKAWIERVPQMFQNVGGIFVSWQIVGNVLEECDEQSKQLINRAPWNRKENSQLFRTISRSDCPHQFQRKPLRNKHAFTASLKKYIDNYEGLVIAVQNSDAKVWSLAIPESEVVFFFGARKGMKVGDWVQFNCTLSLRPYLDCYLQGKKFEIIEPILPAKPFNDTVQVEIMTTIAVGNLKYYPTGEVILETETLGAVEFGPRKFRQDYRNKCLSLIVCKTMPSKRTGAVWQVFCVVNKGSQQQQPDLSSDLPGTSQKEIDDSFYSGFPHNNNTFGNGNAENVKEAKEYDPLKKPAFGTVRPLVLQLNPSAYSSGTGGFNTHGHPSIGRSEELCGDEQEELGKRAREYWIRAWQIPEVRRELVKADKILYEDVMELMTDLNARTDEDSLEEVLKSVLNRRTNDN